MAQFTFSNNTYAGSEVAGFMASTLLEADSVKRGLWTVIEDVKARKIILDVDDEVVLQNPSGLFVDQNTTATQNESYLDPVIYEFMKTEQWDNVIKSWESASVKPGAMMDYEGVINLTDFLMARYTQKLQIANERLYYLGKGNVSEVSFSAAYPGVLSQAETNGSTYKVSLSGGTLGNMPILSIALNTGVATVTVTATSAGTLKEGDVVTLSNISGSLADAIYGNPNGQSYWIKNVTATTFQLLRNYNEVNKRRNATFTGSATVSGTAGTISYINAANVIDVLASVYAQMDQADREQDDFHLQLPKHVAYAFAQAQANKATNVLNAFTDSKTYKYLGVNLDMMNHWLGNTIMGARTSNLFLGVDLLRDTSDLTSVFLGPYTNDQVFKTRARMSSCTNIKFFNEIFYLTY
ncbi:MAG: hypothetical protein P4L31_07470 [Candidatus Babeliales bacterium]|nr:hypothetical protein [Candidatus Babeliales bacterium]